MQQKRLTKTCIAIGVITMGLPHGPLAWAQDVSPGTLIVATRHVPPFILQNKEGVLEGTLPIIMSNLLERGVTKKAAVCAPIWRMSLSGELR